MKTVSILDYGCGNHASVAAAFNRLNCDVTVINHCDQCGQPDLLILPGVGSFDIGINSLSRLGFDYVIRNHIANGGHLLGICLGFQLLFSHGTEGGSNSGLDLIPGHCSSFTEHQLFDRSTSLPHVGFSSVDISGLNLKSSKSIMDFYFVHSYQVQRSSQTPDECRLIEASYGGSSFVAGVHYKNIWGFQFHPEKSQSNGLSLLNSILLSI